MKKMILAISLIILIAASQAAAILTPSSNQLGLYFDTNADMVCVDAITPYAVVPVHLIYTFPSWETILGVSAGLHTEGEMMVLNAELPGGTLNPDDPTRWYGSWPSPQPTTEAMILVSFEVLYMDTSMGPAYLYLGSYDQPLGGIPEVMIADGTLIPTETVFPPGFWMAGINAGCENYPVSTESHSLSALKALYR